MRRKFLAGASGAFAQMACSGSRGGNCAKDERQDPTTQGDIFLGFQRGLAGAHHELLDASQTILTTLDLPSIDRGSVTQAVNHFSDELLQHHKAEDAFFFPAFRAAGRLRSSDIAFLTKLDNEHRDIHRLTLELRTIANAAGTPSDPSWRASIVNHVKELCELSTPHFAAEERTLTAEHVATMLTARELADVYQDMQQNWNNR